MGVTVKVGPKYQVVIPQGVRKKIDLHPQDEMLVEEINGIVVLIPKPKSFTELMIGLGKEIWKDIDVKEYLKKERESWK
jgi:AbrB family looped-hinge helix DNA binding protein